MRSKNNKKKRSAYRRGEKVVIFLRRGIIALSVVTLVLTGILVVRLSARAFHTGNVIISGNYYLEEDEIMRGLGIKEGDGLTGISFKDLGKRLKKHPWIKEVSLRRQFPDTLMLRIKEAVPKALLSLNGRMFLIDDDGRILEEIRDRSTPFLPVIKGVSPARDRKGLMEALKLVDALAEDDILSAMDSIEINLKPYGLAMVVDGKIIKVGYGGYSVKLARWMEIEEELRRRGVAISYIDLRFKDVIVKPKKKPGLQSYAYGLYKKA